MMRALLILLAYSAMATPEADEYADCIVPADTDGPVIFRTPRIDQNQFYQQQRRQLWT